MGNIFDSNEAVLSKEVLDTEVLDSDVLENGKGKQSDKSPNTLINAFYDKDGSYLGTDNIKEDRMYITSSFTIEYLTNKNGEIDWNTIKKTTICRLLSIPHTNFQYCAGVISHEGTDQSLEEMIAIAHATRNNVTQDNKMAKILSTGFSRVDKSLKKPLPTNISSTIAENARAGVIHALTEDDTTDGAKFWDGEDFLAWGKDRPAKAGGGEFPKLIQGVEMSKEIYDAFLSAVLAEYPSGKISYKSIYGVVCDVPNRVFLDSANWFEGGTQFKYKTDGGMPTLRATLTAGRSIFWKKI